MRRLRTLRVRFALWLAGLLATALLLFGAIVYVSLAQGLAASVDDSLKLNTAQTIAAVNIESGQVNFADSVAEGGPLLARSAEKGLTIRILSPSGQVLEASGPFRNLPVPPEVLTAATRNQMAFLTQVAAPGQPAVRVCTAAIVENGTLVGFVQTAQSLASVRESLARLLTTLLISIPTIVLLAGLGGFFLAARALAPIDRITQMARRISVQDLSRRLGLPPTEDEVGRLADTFDDMLARLEESFRRERQFTADVSHELRTPLAATQAIVSVTLQRERTPAEYRQALQDISEETDRLRSLVETLMFLVRGDQGRASLSERVDLSRLLVDTAESVRPLAEAKALRLTVSVPDGMAVLGAADSLIRLFINLLDNAVKYTERGEVTLSAARRENCIEVQVRDTGVGIARRDLARVFDRFYRGDASRSTTGSGLGLAIARQIAHQHGGDITVASQLGQGSTFIVLLPDDHSGHAGH